MTKVVKLGEICDINSGGTPNRGNSKFYDGDIPWAKISDIENATGGLLTKTEESITIEGLASINNRIFEKGTLLLAIYGSVGKVAIAGIRTSTNQAILGIRPKTGLQMEIRYLKHWFTLVKQRLLNRAVGAALQNISLGIVKDLEIPLPSLPEQRRIAALLDRADALRQKDRQLLAHYDALAQSVFLDMFGDPVRNEKGWEIFLLGEVADIVSGVTKNAKLNGSNMIEAPYMRVANVQDGSLDLREIKTIQVSQKDYVKYKLKVEDILLTEGGDPDKLGRGAVWNNAIENCIHQNHIFRVRPDKRIINSQYLCTHIGSLYGKKYFLKAAKQTTGIASINMTQLKEFPAQIPPLSLQTQFATAIERIEAQKAVIRRQMAESEALFGRLLQESFGG